MGQCQVFDREEKITAVTRLYNEIGIDKMAQAKIAYYFEQSKKYLDAVQVPQSVRKNCRSMPSA